MEDNERCIYCPDIFWGCIPDSPSPEAKGWQVLDPRRGWRIESENVNKGKLDAASLKITLPKAIGKDGNKIVPGLFQRSKYIFRNDDIKNANAKPESIPAKKVAINVIGGLREMNQQLIRQNMEK